MRVNVAILSGVEDVKKEDQQCNIKDALLLKKARVGDLYEKFPVLVTAGECGVFFGSTEDMHKGLRFTVEEWNRVVEFVDSQIITAHESEDWQPDWSDVDPKYCYMAVDKDREVFVFVQEPKLTKSIWEPMPDVFRGEYEEVYNQIIPANLDWQQSLRKRPGV